MSDIVNEAVSAGPTGPADTALGCTPLDGRPGLWERLWWAVARNQLRNRIHKRVKKFVARGQPDVAIKHLRRLALLGDVDAQYQLGRCFADGKGVVRCIPDAMVWMRRAAEQGHRDAQGYLGQMFTFGQGRQRDYFDPARWYANAEAEAQENSTLLYPSGVNVERDEAEGIRWFQLAAEQGHPVALTHIGMLVHQGQKGFEKDTERGIAMLQQAAEQNFAGAHYALARVFRFGDGAAVDLSKALEHYRAAAEADHLDAAFEYGMLLVGDGAQQDLTEGARWLAVAADRGHTLAQLNFGNLYRRGHGVEQNYHLAAFWFRRASAHPLAQLNLGRMYNMGQGVKRDYFEAAECYRKAATHGIPQAQFNLAMMYAKGEGVLRDDDKAGEWFLAAARQGHMEARMNIGLFHARGRLKASDPVRAMMWFDLARSVALVEQYPYIDRLKAELEARLSPEQLADARALVEAWTPEAVDV